MKQTTGKITSLALSLALALSLFAGMTAFADDPAAAPAAPSTPSASQNAANTAPAPANSAPTNSTGTSSGAPASGSASVSSSTPAVQAPFISNYSVDVKNDSQLFPGGKADITITVVDEWADSHGVQLRARINTGSFVGKDAIEPYAEADHAIHAYKFEFKDIEYTGGDNTFKFDIITEDPVNVREIVTLSLPVNQCAERPEPTPSPSPAPAEVPKIMVKDFTFGGTSVEAGKEFTLELTLFTTSGNTNLEDVMVGLTFPTDSKSISLASGSMNTYVGTMAPGATSTISYKMVTDATMNPGAVSITVQLTSKNGEAVSSPISIPVTQPERFEITNIEAPETMMMGEEGYLSVTFVNKGKSSINNLTAEIQGENLANPGQSQFLGNVAAGTENSVDFSVMASAEGVISGKVILSYENAKGETTSLEKEFSCTVQAMPAMDDPGMMDPGMMDPGMMDPTMGEDVGGGMPVWGWALIVVGVGAVAAVIVVVIRKKQAAKKLAQLEDEDEDI
ncbi:hypothetical protein [Candidatus Allofournierella merdavium]|uniref:hypothetical protein n=1 Tax=Candidatus Allofournierella merdavium TaxID=2838593 RepID=UPI00374EF0C3